ncbi:MAG: TIGR00725 family protein [Deltaproteobacteria bacterium]|nr:TIGR00725 family protein [Deltaproteobacteria bacterium]MBW1952870.1 TIGR00725 family protein [Deltaproteobacteria bacterium]MBW1985868.1 TIGR00725 family protein [Deltaproteobacteria bacterium]MBW2133628.1 TIGR00725 family protein [Deltaproteobacteria bacterium]
MSDLGSKIYIAVIGGGEVTSDLAGLAREVGQEIARQGAILLCGGLGGVMAAAARGVQEAGGVSIGILPGADRQAANPYLTYSIVTNLGHARNVLLAHSADALIAVDGSYGTVSEAAISLKLRKPVITLKVNWELPGLIPARNPKEAVSLALRSIKV